MNLDMGGNCIVLGAIEAGGTKFLCAVGDMDFNVIDKIEIPTTSPRETIEKVKDFFRQYNVRSMGIGSFGPADVNIDSPNYGCITTTPKEQWQYFNLITAMKDVCDFPIVFDTDVNFAALGEVRFGAARHVKSCIYVTIGTGIGVGAIVNNQILHGLSHPEMGHIVVRRHKNDLFEGACPFHQDCLEGLASGPSIEKRWSKEGFLLESNHEAWEIEGYYIAQALMTYILTLSPEKIILGGGVIKQRQLLPIIYHYLKKLNEGYISLPQMDEQISEYIVTPELDGLSAIKGGFYLAKKRID
ncbi:ROK family protein [Lederbergia citrea]|uniref:ROK family protein n=1 Tax=Lederbergia citrea TaxID=2833581 RepID=UPI00201631AA|nr:ROK family protein [Lederbergia citrea]